MWVEVKTYQAKSGMWGYTFRDHAGRLHGDIGFMSQIDAYTIGVNRSRFIA